MNVGVHFFDMLIWFFGNATKTKVLKMTPEINSVNYISKMLV